MCLHDGDIVEGEFDSAGKQGTHGVDGPSPHAKNLVLERIDLVCRIERTVIERDGVYRAGDGIAARQRRARKRSCLTDADARERGVRSVFAEREECDLLDADGRGEKRDRETAVDGVGGRFDRGDVGSRLRCEYE